MLTVAAAFCLIAALVIDVSRSGSLTPAALWFAVAGLVLLLLSVVFPSRRR